MKTHQLAHLRLDADTHEFLRKRAFEERVSIAELVRRAVEATYANDPEFPRDGS